MKNNFYATVVENKNNLDRLVLSNPKIRQSKAFKYIDDYHVYLSEKCFLIEIADLNPNSHCLDISTGAGFLPWLLRELEHTCDATDIEDWDKDLDVDEGNQIAFNLIREFHGVNIMPLHIGNRESVVLSKKYDCIFSTRIVFNDKWTDDSYRFFINNMLEYTDKVVLKWNFELDETPEILKEYIHRNQFENGTITVHTEKI